MSSINGVILGVAVSTPNRDEGAAPGSISNWSLDWRQAFEQARQVEYGDWFGSGGPTVSQLPKPKVAPETANALLSASLRQSMKPDHSSSVEFRSPTVVSDAVPESHRGKARTPEAAERSHTRRPTMLRSPNLAQRHLQMDTSRRQSLARTLRRVSG